MKKLFALLLALAMLLSCTAAFADATPAGETPEAGQPTALTIYSETDIDRNVLALALAAMGMDEANILKADTVAAVLTEADERLTVADNGFQLDLILSGRDIVTVAGEINDSGLVFGTNLIPNHVFTVSVDELTAMANAVPTDVKDNFKAMERIDLDAVARAVAPYFSEFIATGLAAFNAGEAKPGDYVINESHYNTMVPIDVDVVAIAKALNKLEQDVLSDPTVAVTIAQFDRSGNITKAAEKAIDPAKAPTLSLETYANVDDQGVQSGPVDTTYTLTMPGQTEAAIVGDVLTDGDDVTATAQIPKANATITASSTATETGHIHKSGITVKGLYFGVTAEVSEEDGKRFNDSDFYFMLPDQRLSCQRSTMSNEGERTYDLSKGAPIALSKLTSKDKNTMSALAADAMMGVASAGVAASEALPEEVSAMLALFGLSKAA